tara:strand:+ start:70 stop:894 length:825 start_codon:yes stop_codon:yes gene_type:complete
MNRIATIILNRNLPGPTDRLYEHLVNIDGELTDVYVLEAGSDKDKLSRYCTWHANDIDIKKNGLRYGRGMNYALLKLYQAHCWSNYDAFFLLTNDTELCQTKTIQPLCDVLSNHSKIGILSPCSKRWGERSLLLDEPTKYFWFIHNHALLLRKEFLESIINLSNPTFMNFVFDGSNFRGFLSESELIAKAYANDWAAAITSSVYAEENQSYLLEKSDLIKTEKFHHNIKLYLEEGRLWIKQKYGFNSRWSMNQYVKSFYDAFFKNNPELIGYKI